MKKGIETAKDTFKASIECCTKIDRTTSMMEINERIRSGRNHALIHEYFNDGKINLLAVQRWLESEGFKTEYKVEYLGYRLKVWGWAE